LFEKRRKRYFSTQSPFSFFSYFPLDGPPRDAVGAALLAVMLLGEVEGFLVDFLGVLGQVVLYAVGRLRDHLVRHIDLLCAVRSTSFSPDSHTP